MKRAEREFLFACSIHLVQQSFASSKIYSTSSQRPDQASIKYQLAGMYTGNTIFDFATQNFTPLVTLTSRSHKC
jgi:hypothetical protein